MIVRNRIAIGNHSHLGWIGASVTENHSQFQFGISLMRLVSLLVASLAFTACGSSDEPEASDGRIVIVASTNVYGDIAKAVGGDRVEVTSILADPRQDPHSFEASTQVRLQL